MRRPTFWPREPAYWPAFWLSINRTGFKSGRPAYSPVEQFINRSKVWNPAVTYILPYIIIYNVNGNKNVKNTSRELNNKIQICKNVVQSRLILLAARKRKRSFCGNKWCAGLHSCLLQGLENFILSAEIFFSPAGLKVWFLEKIKDWSQYLIFVQWKFVW